MKKQICLLLVIALIAGLFPAVAHAGEMVSEDYCDYGYSFLSEKEKTVYDLVEDCIKDAENELKIDYDFGISVERFQFILEMFSADNPEYFWFTGAYSYGHYANIVMGFYPKYVINGNSVTKSEIQSADMAFQQATEQVMAQMNQETGTNDYARAVWLHDKVAELVCYEKGPNHQTAYGALVDGKAVCAGYARLYQHLLKCAGIKAWTVEGTSLNPASNTAENHAWTLMWLDGKCVYADVTWGDQGEDLYHVYFARSLADMSFDHTAGELYSELLPACNCEGYGYFDVYSPDNKISGSITAARVNDLMVPNGDGRSWSAVLFDPTGTQVMNWIRYSGEIWGIVEGRGAGDFSISTRSMGNEHQGLEIHLKLVNNSVPVGVEVSGTISSYINGTDFVSVQLIKDGSKTADYQMSVTGKSASYSFTGVAAGTYTLKVMKKNHVTRELSITVTSSKVVADVKICPVGDVTGDGKANMKDWSALYAHINEQSVLSGYAYACADVTGDGKLNMKDWNRLYGHVSESAPLW